MRTAGSSQPDAAVTLPVCVVKPTLRIALWPTVGGHGSAAADRPERSPGGNGWPTAH